MSIFVGIALATSHLGAGLADLAIPTTNAVIVELLIIAFGVWAMLKEHRHPEVVPRNLVRGRFTSW